jgi:hypothetical protein
MRVHQGCGGGRKTDETRSRYRSARHAGGRVGHWGGAGRHPGDRLRRPVVATNPNVAASVDGLTGTAAALGTADIAPVSAPVLNVAISFDGMTLFQEGDAAATSGTGDLAIALGAGSDALATVGNFDSATVVGTDSSSVTENGNGDLASVVNTGSTEDVAFAGGTDPSFLSSNDIASVLGTDSSAFAGGDSSAVGNFDLAAVFGDMLTATATGGSGLVDILPSL